VKDEDSQTEEEQFAALVVAYDDASAIARVREGSRRYALLAFGM
jgi:hypothetical protein